MHARSLTRSTMALLVVLLLLAAACGSGDDDAETTATEEAPADDGASEAAPVTGPASIAADDQSGSGESVLVASVTLPTDGFVVIHDGAGGSPGPVIGHSELLPEGDSSDVEVPLDQPLAASGMVFPMAHVDANGNGVYEFAPPEETTDAPATTEAGDVAVLGIAYTLEGEDAGDDAAGADAEQDGDAATADGAATITIADFDFGAPVTVGVGESVTVENTDGAPHTWTADDDEFDSGTISPGESFSTTLDASGEFAFHCEIHPNMTGSITVEA